MTKSELIDRISLKYKHLAEKDVESSVNMIINYMSESLSKGNRIEVRKFGSFALRHRSPRRARNPKTGEQLQLKSRYVAFFTAGKILKDRINGLSTS